MAEKEPRGDGSTVKEGYFGVKVTMPDGKTEHFEGSARKLEVVGGNIVITNKISGRVTILPPGSKVTTSE